MRPRLNRPDGPPTPAFVPPLPAAKLPAVAETNPDNPRETEAAAAQTIRNAVTFRHAGDPAAADAPELRATQRATRTATKRKEKTEKKAKATRSKSVKREKVGTEKVGQKLKTLTLDPALATADASTEKKSSRGLKFGFLKKQKSVGKMDKAVIAEPSALPAPKFLSAAQQEALKSRYAEFLETRTEDLPGIFAHASGDLRAALDAVAKKRFCEPELKFFVAAVRYAELLGPDAIVTADARDEAKNEVINVLLQDKPNVDNDFELVGDLQAGTGGERLRRALGEMEADQLAFSIWAPLVADLRPR